MLTGFTLLERNVLINVFLSLVLSIEERSIGRDLSVSTCHYFRRDNTRRLYISLGKTFDLISCVVCAVFECNGHIVSSTRRLTHSLPMSRSYWIANGCSIDFPITFTNLKFTKYSISVRPLKSHSTRTFTL